MERRGILLSTFTRRLGKWLLQSASYLIISEVKIACWEGIRCAEQRQLVALLESKYLPLHSGY